MKHVKNDILRIKENRFCLVSTWFQDILHTRDYIPESVKNYCKSTINFSIMQYKEKKICSYSSKNCKLRLVAFYDPSLPFPVKYSVYDHRRVVRSSMTEDEARKHFANYVFMDTLQLRIPVRLEV